MLIQCYSLIQCNTCRYNAPFPNTLYRSHNQIVFLHANSPFLIQTGVRVPTEWQWYMKQIQFYSKAWLFWFSMNILLSDVTSTGTSSPEHAGQKPAHQSHIEHRVNRIGSNGAASGGTSHKIVISKPHQRAAKGKQQRGQPVFNIFFHRSQLLFFVWPQYIARWPSLPWWHHASR